MEEEEVEEEEEEEARVEGDLNQVMSKNKMDKENGLTNPR